MKFISRSFLLLLIIVVLPFAFANEGELNEEPFYTVYTGDCHIPIPLSMAYNFATNEFFNANASILNEAIESSEEFVHKTRKARLSLGQEIPSFTFRGVRYEPELLTEQKGFSLFSLSTGGITSAYFITSSYSTTMFSLFGFRTDQAQAVFEYCISHRDRMFDRENNK